MRTHVERDRSGVNEGILHLGCGGTLDKNGWEPPTQTILHDTIILIASEMSLFWTDFNVSNRFLSNDKRHSSTFVTFTAEVNCKSALFNTDVIHSFTQVC